jgi:hypothetical protein
MMLRVSHVIELLVVNHHCQKQNDKHNKDDTKMVEHPLGNYVVPTVKRL